MHLRFASSDRRQKHSVFFLCNSPWCLSFSDRLARSAPAAVREQDSKKDVLLVLDPNGLHCWEDVDIDSVTNSTLLPFIHTLGDALTVGKLPGSLLPLQV